MSETSESVTEENYEGTITITFGEQVENHVGMQKIGEIADEGVDIRQLRRISKTFENCELVKLHRHLDEDCDPAYVLIIRNGVSQLKIDDDELFEEQKELEWDTQAYMYGRVVNKKARYNLCYNDESQEPDYENKKGRVIAWKEMPLLKKLKKGIVKKMGFPKNIKAEGNYYYDIEKCGIGFHGDSERRIVVGVRLGESLPLHYQWYHKLSPVGERIELELHHGDIYIMSAKAVGNDWKKKNIYTLRHAAGCEKFLYPKK